MRRLHVIFILVLIPVWAGPAHAQLFGKRLKANPVQRVPELIMIVKTDPDERKRAAAADELRDYDSKQFPEIAFVLIDVAQNDAAAGVRSEAIGSLAKIRPVTQEAGQVMDNAAAKDPSAKVRWQAKTSLWGYRLAGYSSGKTNTPNVVDKNTGNNGKFPMTQEPPLGEVIIIQPGSGKPATLPQFQVTPNPAPAVEVKKSEPSAPEFRPVTNTRPGFSTAVPQQPRILNTPPPPLLPAPPPPVAPTPPLEPMPREVNPLPLPTPPPPPAKDEGPSLTPPR